jgi:hypothetical protein
MMLNVRKDANEEGLCLGGKFKGNVDVRLD